MIGATAQDHVIPKEFTGKYKGDDLEILYVGRRDRSNTNFPII
jgi:hypothetical protein